MSDKEVVKAFQAALKDVYKDATPKATQAMLDIGRNSTVATMVCQSGKKQLLICQ